MTAAGDRRRRRRAARLPGRRVVRAQPARRSSTAYAGRELTADEQTLLDGVRRRQGRLRGASTRPATGPTWLPIPLAAIDRSAGRGPRRQPDAGASTHEPVLPVDRRRARAAGPTASTATRTRSSARTPHDGGVTVRVVPAAGRRSVVVVRRPSGSEHAELDARVRRHLGRRARPSPTCPTTGVEVDYGAGRDHRRRPLPLPADPRRDGPAPDQRGPPRAAVDGARRARAPLRRAATGAGHRHVVRGLGAAAPRGVRLKGDFNSWDGREHPMRQLGDVRRLGAVRARRRRRHAATSSWSSAPTAQWREKADPMAFHTEVPPATSSVVFESTYSGATTTG